MCHFSEALTTFVKTNVFSSDDANYERTRRRLQEDFLFLFNSKETTAETKTHWITKKLEKLETRESKEAIKNE